MKKLIEKEEIDRILEELESDCLQSLMSVVSKDPCEETIVQFIFEKTRLKTIREFKEMFNSKFE